MQQKELFIVGDIHSCFYSFQKLLEEHWNPEKALLVQVGDLISKGNFGPKVLALAQELEHKYQAVFIQGNHEFMLLEHYLRGRQSMDWANAFIRPLLEQYKIDGRTIEEDLDWIAARPLFWEHDKVLVTHAGISHLADAIDIEYPYGVLWNRSPLKNIGKLQVIGHTPTRGRFVYEPEPNYCNVDTGAFMGFGLTAVKINLEEEAIVPLFVSVATDERDIR